MDERRTRFVKLSSDYVGLLGKLPDCKHMYKNILVSIYTFIV